MASISTQVNLIDRMSAPINSIISAVDNLCVAYQSVDTSATDGFNAAKTSIDSAKMAMNNLTAATETLPPAINKVSNSVGGLSNAFGKIGGILGTVFAISRIVNFGKECTEAANTENNAIAQLQATLANTSETPTESFKELSNYADKIQEAGMYGNEAMLGAAAEFSTYMSDTSAIETMMDTLTDYAAGMTGGGSVGYQEMINFATNLGKITTGSYDAMTKKGFSFTDAQKAIIKGTATMAQKQDALGEKFGETWKNMSDDMLKAQVIAQVVGESWDGMYEKMSGTAEAQNIKIMNSWGDLKEEIGSKINGAISQFMEVIQNNWGTIEKIFNSVGTALHYIIIIASEIVNVFLNIAEVVMNNWSGIEPFLYGIIAGIVLFNTIMGITNAVMGITNAIIEINNALLYANPITLIVAAVAALIALLIIIAGKIIQITGLSNSFLGGIAGVVSVVIAFIYNLIASFINTVISQVINLWNLFRNFGAGILVAFTDPIGGIKIAFLSLLNFIVGIAKNAASILDTIFGSHLADGVSDFQSKIQAEIDTTIEKSGAKVPAALKAEDYTLKRMEYGTSFENGVNFGDSISEEFSDTNSIFNQHLEGIDKNTKDTADSLSVATEDLKYLYDIAERDVINRFTTAEIRVDMTNNNSISNGMDIDTIIDKLGNGVREAMGIAAEGVYS